MLNAASQKLLIPGPVGAIDVSLDMPTQAIRGAAIVAHPHPLYGGARDNKVVQTLARTLVSLGYVCWCPNFRGVGASEGAYDEGSGESDDLLTLSKHALTHSSVEALAEPKRLVLAGFSFGSFVQTRVHDRLLAVNVPVEKLILVGAPVARFAMVRAPAATLVIHGEIDDVAPLADVFRWAQTHELAVTVIPGADHFFHRKLGFIKQIVTQAWPVAE
jgi:uncharacterized protein